jgi:hypothetical protein
LADNPKVAHIAIAYLAIKNSTGATPAACNANASSAATNATAPDPQNTANFRIFCQKIGLSAIHLAFNSAQNDFFSMLLLFIKVYKKEYFS